MLKNGNVINVFRTQLFFITVTMSKSSLKLELRKKFLSLINSIDQMYPLMCCLYAQQFIDIYSQNFEIIAPEFTYALLYNVTLQLIFNVNKENL